MPGKKMLFQETSTDQKRLTIGSCWLLVGSYTILFLTAFQLTVHFIYMYTSVDLNVYRFIHFINHHDRGLAVFSGSLQTLGIIFLRIGNNVSDKAVNYHSFLAIVAFDFIVFAEDKGPLFLGTIIIFVLMATKRFWLPESMKIKSDK